MTTTITTSPKTTPVSAHEASHEKKKADEAAKDTYTNDTTKSVSATPSVTDSIKPGATSTAAVASTQVVRRVVAVGAVAAWAALMGTGVIAATAAPIAIAALLGLAALATLMGWATPTLPENTPLALRISLLVAGALGAAMGVGVLAPTVLPLAATTVAGIYALNAAHQSMVAPKPAMVDGAPTVSTSERALQTLGFVAATAAVGALIGTGALALSVTSVAMATYFGASALATALDKDLTAGSATSKGGVSKAVVAGAVAITLAALIGTGVIGFTAWPIFAAMFFGQQLYAGIVNWANAGTTKAAAAA